MNFKLTTLVVSLLVLAGCGPTDKEKAMYAEQQRIHCLSNLCDGETPPKVQDPTKEFSFKVNGEWFIGPRDYGGYGGSFAFLWPSKTPARSERAAKDAPEFIPSSAGVRSNFYDVGVEIFLRSNNIPAEPHGYKLIQLAESKDWIFDRKMLRPGLEAITMKRVQGPTGHRIDDVTYYVATNLKGIDGLPPVATCSHADPRNGGGTGFMWQPGIWVGTRMNQRHCADWPEIYQETIRILQLIKKA